MDLMGHTHHRTVQRRDEDLAVRVQLVDVQA